MFQKSAPKTIDELVAKVTQAFEEYPVERSNRVFLTHQSCMKEIMKERGSHHYAIPHMKISVLQKNGVLPVALACDPELVQQANEFVNV